jgi:nitric oxide reductase large subunit
MISIRIGEMMKKLLNTSFAYAIAGLTAGVYYRELTRFVGYTGASQLSVVHTHLLALGMMMFLIVLLLEKNFELSQSKKFKTFYRLYNGGLILTVMMFLLRGTLQVFQTELSSGLSASLSGIAGIGHILIAGGVVYLFITLKDRIK